MERSLNMHTPIEIQLPRQDSRAVANAAWHSLFWLVVANAVGVLIAILLLFPALNKQLGEWTYGRWMMVHMNLELYGWTSLPLVGFLFKVYGADRGPTANWCRPVLWLWSAALGRGCVLLALRTFQRQALPRLERIHARVISRCASGALAAARHRPD